MPDELLQRFTRTYQPGAPICREGEEGEEMYIIQNGKVRVSKQFGGKTHVVSVLEKGDFFGEMAIVNRVRRTATVTAIDQVELLVFDREGLQNMIARNTRIALTIIDKLCRRLQNAHVKIQHLVKRDAEGLIALHLDAMYQELPSAAAAVPYQKCLEEVSLSLELPMEAVRSNLQALVGAGVLRLEGDALFLQDRAGLHQITEAVGKEAPSPAG